MNAVDKYFVNLTYKSNFGSDGDGSGMYEGLNNKLLYSEQGFWAILSKGAVYASAIALIISFGYMVWYANRPDKTKDAKERVARTCGVIIAIFSITGVIGLIQAAALK